VTGLTTFTRIGSYLCDVRVVDQGGLPHQDPTGDVSFTASAGARLSIGPRIVKGGGDNVGYDRLDDCPLNHTISIGVSECEITVAPRSDTPVGTQISVNATFKPESNTFMTSNATTVVVNAPRIDPASKQTASHAGKYLGREAVVSAIAATGIGAVASKIPPVGPGAAAKVTLQGIATVAAVAGTALTFIAQPFSELSDRDDPPDPAYAQVYAPRIAAAVQAIPTSFSGAVTAFATTERQLDGWAGADWNALNRAVVAEDQKDAKALATQMQAASTDEAEMAALVVKLPTELATIKSYLSPSEVAQFTFHFTDADLKSLEPAIEKTTAADDKLAGRVGLNPSLVEAATAANAKQVTAADSSGNVVTNLTAVVAEEASYVELLKKVAAEQQAIAHAYTTVK
jgi:hypothetical protein